MKGSWGGEVVLIWKMSPKCGFVCCVATGVMQIWVQVWSYISSLRRVYVLMSIHKIDRTGRKKREKSAAIALCPPSLYMI